MHRLRSGVTSIAPTSTTGCVGSIENVAVNTGNAATISMLAASAVQEKIGMYPSFIPGARHRMMVVTRLMPDNSVPNPEICNDHR